MSRKTGGSTNFIVGLKKWKKGEAQQVLLSSGYPLNGPAEDIVRRGCRGFIQKPFTIEQLSHKIREILSSGQDQTG